MPAVSVHRNQTARLRYGGTYSCNNSSLELIQVSAQARAALLIASHSSRCPLLMQRSRRTSMARRRVSPAKKASFDPLLFLAVGLLFDAACCRLQQEYSSWYLSQFRAGSAFCTCLHYLYTWYMVAVTSWTSYIAVHKATSGWIPYSARSAYRCFVNPNWTASESDPCT